MIESEKSFNSAGASEDDDGDNRNTDETFAAKFTQVAFVDPLWGVPKKMILLVHFPILW